MSNLKALVAGLGRPSGTTLGALNAHHCEKVKRPEHHGRLFLNLWLWYSFTRIQPVDEEYNCGLAQFLCTPSSESGAGVTLWWQGVHAHYTVVQVESSLISTESFSGWQLGRAIPLATVAADQAFQNDARSMWRAAALFGDENHGENLALILRAQRWLVTDFVEEFIKHWTENR